MMMIYPSMNENNKDKNKERKREVIDKSGDMNDDKNSKNLTM